MKNLALAVVLVIVIGASALFVAPRWREHQLMRQAEPIQASLERYRWQHGRYPDSVREIGVAESSEGPLFYSRQSDSSYVIWFGTDLGESRTFNSTERKWH